jgi:Ohr subfamily peroxiredoxin
MTIETVDVLYTATAKAEGGRNGTTLSGDGLIDVNLSVPKAMGGPGKPGATTPEDLFAAGYAACFGGAVDFLATKNNLKPSSLVIESAVGIGKTPTGVGLKVELTAKVGGLSQADAEKIVALGHAFCPYSKAIQGNVEVTVKTVVV